MPVEWNLKKWLAVERDIYRPSELQALIIEKTGVHLSLQAVSALVNGKPGAVRFQTIEVLCHALDCHLCDFCDVSPPSVKEQQKQRKVAGEAPRRLYGVGARKETKKPDSIFPDPRPQINKEQGRQEKG